MAKKLNNPNQLLDSWNESGTNAFDLTDVIGRMAKNTRIKKMRGAQMRFHCVTNDGAEDVIKACPADPMRDGSGRYVKVSLMRQKGFPMSNWPLELYDEALSRDKIFVSFTDDKGEYHFMPATTNLSSDFALLGITGKASETASYHLLGLVAEQIEDKQITFVTRIEQHKSGNIEKIITMRSDGYAYIPQDEALELASLICADGDIRHWSVNNFFTEVLYEFPNHAVSGSYGRKRGDFTPYIRYTTSDAGDSSCSFELGWDINGHYVFLASGKNRVFRTHRGEWNDAMKNALYQEAIKLKDKFVVLEERMMELQSIAVPNANIERVVRHLCSDVKITGKASQDAFVEYVLQEFGTTDATAAEIVLAMIEAQDASKVLKDLSDGQRVVMQHKLGEAPYQRIRQNI